MPPSLAKLPKPSLQAQLTAGLAALRPATLRQYLVKIVGGYFLRLIL